ncbi:MAG TPA: hypothetical protein VEA60_04840 [Allosphingosinicella sp.]|nr:hypothetical protein [Allosphingosinicella sp.]
MRKTLKLKLSYEKFAELESRQHIYKKPPRIRIDKRSKRVTATFPRLEDYTLAKLSI